VKRMYTPKYSVNEDVGKRRALDNAMLTVTAPGGSAPQVPSLARLP
jgi:hypothetical protein